MTKEEKRNNIIGLIIVLLIGGGVYFYNNNQKEEMPIPENVGILVPPAENIEDVTPSTGEATTSENSETSTSTKPTVSTVDKTKFNLAMDNARKAFGKGEYAKAITYYEEALKYHKEDTVYSGLFNVYGAQGDWIKAKIALDTAISFNPRFHDYWTSKLILMDEKLNATFAEMKKVYTEGMTKVDPKYKINLVTQFARIAESNGETKEAIALWTYAKTVYPDNSTIYQAEIDRLKAL